MSCVYTNTFVVHLYEFQHFMGNNIVVHNIGVMCISYVRASLSPNDFIRQPKSAKYRTYESFTHFIFGTKLIKYMYLDDCSFYKNLADAEVKRSLSSQIQFMQGT